MAQISPIVAISKWFRRDDSADKERIYRAAFDAAMVEHDRVRAQFTQGMMTDGHDQGWMNVRSKHDGYMMLDPFRKQIIQRSRQMVVVHPLAKQIESLYREFGVGTGLSWSAQTDEARAIIQAVFDNPINNPVMSRRGQRLISDRVVTDGEVFLAIFGQGAETVVRPVPALEVEEILTGPDDVYDVRGFRRVFTTRTGEIKEQIYCSIWNDALLPGYDAVGRAHHMQGRHKMLSDMVEGDLRGVPVLSASLDLLQAQSLFLRDRVAIMRALAVFTWKVKMRGGTQEDINDLVKRFSSTIDPWSATREQNPKHAAGSTAISNDNVDLQPFTVNTNAENANTDNEMLSSAATAGAGVYNHWVYGGGAMSNYAQANSMDAPLFKKFESHQAFIMGVYRALFRHILKGAGFDGRDAVVDIEMPPIIRKDTPAMLDGITKALAQFPEMLQSNEAVRQLAMRMDLQNVDTVMAEIGRGPGQQENEG